MTPGRADSASRPFLFAMAPCQSRFLAGVPPNCLLSGVAIQIDRLGASNRGKGIRRSFPFRAHFHAGVQGLPQLTTEGPSV